MAPDRVSAMEVRLESSIARSAPHSIAMNHPPDPLDTALEALRTSTPTQPESVQHEVWRRIAHGAQADPGEAEAQPWWRRLEAAFARPAFAAAFVAACLLLGLFLAEMRLTRLQAERTAALEQSYLRLVDPLFRTTDTPRAQPAVHRP